MSVLDNVQQDLVVSMAVKGRPLELRYEKPAAKPDRR